MKIHRLNDKNQILFLAGQRQQQRFSKQEVLLDWFY